MNHDQATDAKHQVIYESAIEPLANAIYEICKKHKIACLMTFNLGPDALKDGQNLSATSALIGGEFQATDEQVIAAEAMFGTLESTKKVMDLAALLELTNPSQN